MDTGPGPVVEYDKAREKVQEMEEEEEGVDPTAVAEKTGENAEVGVGGIGIGSSTMNQVVGPAAVVDDSGDPPWTAAAVTVVVVVVAYYYTDAVVGSPCFFLGF